MNFLEQGDADEPGFADETGEVDDEEEREEQSTSLVTAPIVLTSNATKKKPPFRKRIKPSKSTLSRPKQQPTSTSAENVEGGTQVTENEATLQKRYEDDEDDDDDENKWTANGNDVPTSTLKQQPPPEKAAPPPKKRARILPKKSAIKISIKPTPITPIAPVAPVNDVHKTMDPPTTTVAPITTEEEKTSEEEEERKPRMSDFCTKFKVKPPHHDAAKKPRVAHPQHPADGSDNAGGSAPAGPVVQIINGEIVLQESSMLLHGNIKPPEEGDEEYQVVEEEDQIGICGSTYMSFARHPRHSIRWNAEETQLFYDAIRQVGVDFITMTSFFASTTKRSQRMLKAKYKKECIHNPHLIEAALKPNRRKEIDLTIFDVTPEDVATIVRPTDPVEQLQPTEETSSNPLPDTVIKINNDMVVEEDAAAGLKEEAASPQKSTNFVGSSFWLEADGEPSKEAEPAMKDDMETQFEEGGEEFEKEEEPAAISLVSRTALPKKTKKPKFFSRKKGK